MSSPFVEAHQFKGVWPDPNEAAIANEQLALSKEQRKLHYQSPEGEDMLRRMLQPPPFDGKQSIYFSNGASFDVQQGNDGRQYLVLPRESKGVLHQQVFVGEWICLLPSGKFIKLTDEDYKALGGT